MKKLVLLMALIFVLPLFQGVAVSDRVNDSYIFIKEPEGGIYFQGKKLMPAYRPFWTVMIGYSSINVDTDSSSNILTAYFTLYDIFTKDVVESQLDATPSDGFHCNFSGVSKGSYLIAVIAVALDPDEPVASDWIAPVIFIPL